MQRVDLILDEASLRLLDRLAEQYYGGSRFLAVQAAVESLAAHVRQGENDRCQHKGEARRGPQEAIVHVTAIRWAGDPSRPASGGQLSPPGRSV